MLSLGERMRCELAASLLHEPDVLFLDEPTLGLDVSGQAALRGFLRDYNARRGATVLLTSHYTGDVTALATRVLVIDRGTLHFDGDLARPRRPARAVAGRPGVAARAGAPERLAPYGEVVSVEGSAVTLRVPRARTARGGDPGARRPARRGPRHRGPLGRGRPAHGVRPWLRSGGLGHLPAAYGGMVRSAVQVAVTYRGRMVLWVVSGFFPLLLMAVWLTVVAESGPPDGWTTGDFLSYYAAAAVIWHLSGQHVVWEWDADMRSGDLSTRLLRPVHPFHQYVAGDAGHRLVLLVGLVPALVVATLLVPGLDYDLTPGLAVLTVVAVLLAYGLSLVMASTVALLGFWSTQTTNVWMLWWGIGSFASGWVAPLELMPDWLRAVAVVLPFRYTLGFPAELLAGRLSGGEVAVGFAVGACWTLLFAGLYVLGWRHGIRRYQAVAG